MVGICGTLGDVPEGPSAFVDGITWSGRERQATHRESAFTLHTAFHDLLADADGVPAETADGTRICVWGDVYGHGEGTGYAPRPGGPAGSARYCARLYDEHGMEFVTHLNGDYCLVLSNPSEGTVTFVTDRVGTRPVYVATPGRGSVVFSSNLQSLAAHPAVEPRYDEDLLYEYLQLRRVFGIQTPLEGVVELPPGSVVTFDRWDGSRETRRYWKPHHDPVDEPPSHFVERIADLLTSILAEWTDDAHAYGLLLSGGSDSRAVQAAFDRRVDAFHVADWNSREARTARRAAATAGDRFHLLERDPDEEAQALARNAPLVGFSGWFDQAYFTGFEADIVEEVDVLVSGLYADMLFDGGALPTRKLDLGSVGELELPLRRSVDTVDDYVDVQTAGAVEPLEYFAGSRSIHETVRDRIERTPEGIVSHGVGYESLTDLLLYGDYVPMSADTDAIFSRSLAQLRPYRTPFLDKRLLDLQQRIPLKYHLRYDLVDRVVERLAPDLAAIPHARTGVALDHPFAVSYVGDKLNAFRRKHVADQLPPEPHFDHSPWPDRPALIRHREFLGDALSRNRDLAQRLPFLDADGADECYREHLDGTNNQTVLYSLATLLEMPLTGQVAARSPSSLDAPVAGASSDVLD